MLVQCFAIIRIAIRTVKGIPTDIFATPVDKSVINFETTPSMSG